MTDRQRQVVEEFFRAYSGGVARYALSRTGNAHAAETITSRVFLKVVNCISQCRGSAVAWLWSIVRTEVALFFRQRRTTQPIDESHRDPAAGPDRQAETRETNARLHAALATLSEPQQQLLEMKFFLSMPNVEIAAALNLSPGNVGVMVHRAVRQLRERMEQPLEEKPHDVPRA